MEVKPHGFGIPKAALQWLRNNPIQSVLGSAMVLFVVPAAMEWYKTSYLPSLVPITVDTSVEAINPSARSLYPSWNGIAYSPIELTVTIKNPGRQVLYLLEPIWTAEACSFVPTDPSSNAAGPNQGQKPFTVELEYNSSLVKKEFGQVFDNFRKPCKLVGAGELLKDRSVRPQEAITGKLAIVYPTEIPASFESADRVKTDVIRITTFIGSSSSRIRDARSRIIFRINTSGKESRRRELTPKTMWVYTEQSAAQYDGRFERDCTLLNGTIPQTLSASRTPKDSPARSTETVRSQPAYKDSQTDAHADQLKTGLCPAPREIAAKYILQRTVNEVWVRDRVRS